VISKQLSFNNSNFTLLQVTDSDDSPASSPQATQQRQLASFRIGPPEPSPLSRHSLSSTFPSTYHPPGRQPTPSRTSRPPSPPRQQLSSTIPSSYSSTTYLKASINPKPPPDSPQLHGEPPPPLSRHMTPRQATPQRVEPMRHAAERPPADLPKLSAEASPSSRAEGGFVERLKRQVADDSPARGGTREVSRMPQTPRALVGLNNLGNTVLGRGSVFSN
jgi:hypothetical protein